MSHHRTAFGPSKFVNDPQESSPQGNFDFRYSAERIQDWPTVLLDRPEASPNYQIDPADRYIATDHPTATTTYTPGSSHRRGGAHRLPAPPAALKGRAAVVAVAAGAVVAAGQAAFSSDGPADDASTSEISLAGQSTSGGIAATAVPQAAQFAAAKTSPKDISAHSDSPQVLNVATPIDVSEFSNLLSKGQKFAEERAAQEASKMRPLYSIFSHGTFTSGFGGRWGTQHLGVDLANAIGTPILAVADGTVISAGPAEGFGLWVRLLHNDGTITVYGHVDSTEVTVGQHVMAGDEIAKMGNRGFSTGPHCHFEVWQNGKDKIDPLPWLASRGISLGPEVD